MRQCRARSLCDNAPPRRPRRTALIRYRVRLADLDRHCSRSSAASTNPRRRATVLVAGMDSGQLPAARLRASRRAASRREERPRAAGGREDRERRVARARRAAARSRSRSRSTRSISRCAAPISIGGAGTSTARACSCCPKAATREPIEVTLEPPPQSAVRGLARRDGARSAASVDERGFGVYRAADYDELLDHPVEIGDFESVEFEAAGVPHHLVVAGRFESDLERVAADLKQLCDGADRVLRPAGAVRSLLVPVLSPSATATAASSIARRRA